MSVSEILLEHMPLYFLRNKIIRTKQTYKGKQDLVGYISRQQIKLKVSSYYALRQLRCIYDWGPHYGISLEEKIQQQS